MIDERHPIPEVVFGVSDVERLRLTRIYLAKLWDQVWWMNLPFWKRWYWMTRKEKFRAPVQSFYGPDA